MNLDSWIAILSALHNLFIATYWHTDTDTYVHTTHTDTHTYTHMYNTYIHMHTHRDR